MGFVPQSEIYLAVVPQSENNFGINPQNGLGINPQTGLGVNPLVNLAVTPVPDALVEKGPITPQSSKCQNSMDRKCGQSLTTTPSI